MKGLPGRSDRPARRDRPVLCVLQLPSPRTTGGHLMRTRADVPWMPISLVLLAALVSVQSAVAQRWPISTRRSPGVPATRTARRPIVTPTTAARTLSRYASQPDPLADAWRNFSRTRPSIAPDPRTPAASSSPERPVAVTSYYPGLVVHHTCSPSRASLLVGRQPRLILHDQPPPAPEFQSWGNQPGLPPGGRDPMDRSGTYPGMRALAPSFRRTGA